MSETATVCRPWRPQPDRLAAYDVVTRYWQEHGFGVVEADSDPDQPFLCSAARNSAVRKATTDIVIIADADTMPEDIDQITTAIEMVRGGRLDFVWPFQDYWYVPGDLADKLNAGIELPARGDVVSITDSPGGMVVTRQDAFWALGGYDERFTPGAWGWDDFAFKYAAETLARVGRTSGVVFSFDHACVRDRSDANPNKARWRLYEFCKDKPSLMRELIKR